jgi:hypothetical protein
LARIGAVFGFIHHIDQPALHDNVLLSGVKIAKGKHAGFRGLVSPCVGLYVLGRSGRLQWVEALGDHLHHARVFEVAPKRGVEDLIQVCRLLIAGNRLEIRNSEADFLDARAGTGFYLIILGKR